MLKFSKSRLSTDPKQIHCLRSWKGEMLVPSEKCTSEPSGLTLAQRCDLELLVGGMLGMCLPPVSPEPPTLDLEVAIQVSPQDPSRKRIFGRNNGSHEGRAAMPPGTAAHLLTSHLIEMTFSANGLHFRLAKPTGGQNQEKWERVKDL